MLINATETGVLQRLDEERTIVISITGTTVSYTGFVNGKIDEAAFAVGKSGIDRIFAMARSLLNGEEFSMAEYVKGRREGEAMQQAARDSKC